MTGGRLIVGGAVAAATLMALAACSGASGSSGSRGATGGAAGGAARDSTRNGRVAALAPDVAGAARSAAGSGSGGSGTVRTTASEFSPQLILTASLSVTVSRSIDTAADGAEAIVAAAGGRTDADDRSAGRGARPTAELTLRVPNSAVPTTMDRLAALGRQTDRRLSTRDVTSEVADVSSRVTSARTAIASLDRLYQRASKVGDVIRIESTLSQREADLESLEARQKALTAQTALATITLDLTQHRTSAPAPAAADTSSGFVGGLRHGWHAFTGVATGLAVATGAVLPFLLVVLVLAAAGLIVRRRWHHPAVPADSDA